MTVNWDQIIIHTCAEVEEYLATNRRITSEPFPAYAPDLNPVDGAWFYIKYDRIPNFAPASMTRLRKAVQRELERLRIHSELLRSFIRDSALPLFM